MTDQAGRAGSIARAHGFDASKPNVARVYDYLLGGKDNFAADRDAAQRLIESFLNGDTSSAAKMLGLFGTVFAAMQFFFSPNSRAHTASRRAFLSTENPHPATRSRPLRANRKPR